MRLLPLFLSAILTVALVIVLNMQLPVGNSKTPRLGYFLSPQQGFWQNAESVATSFDGTVKVQGLQGKAEVFFDDRLVPHIYAASDKDAYYIQGYLHAKFRLWQMEFQTRVASGRLSEILPGKDKLEYDKFMRRFGMVYGAEHSLAAMEADTTTKAAMDAYTAGVNAYISQLKDNELPFEYKLLDYRPEPWTNLKTALFLKLMSLDLAGGGNNDLLATNTKNFFGFDKYKKLFPEAVDSLSPIVPSGTLFKMPAVNPAAPKDLDSAYIGKTTAFNTIAPVNPDPNNGSNNWTVAGSRTQSGRPILCNDPHLGLNLPSLWYEVQITTPTHSVYGASFPGTPAVIIGFNDSCAWGVTNSERDVKDYYEIKFRDSTMQQYWAEGEWKNSSFRDEIIKIKDQPDNIEHIAVTGYGLVMYDDHYKATDSTGKCYAVRWKATDSSNELLTFCKLDKAHNHADYLDAISTFECPGQNFAFATKSGDIAICQQGKFVAKWNRQGEFVMPADSGYRWQGYIPNAENPQLYNPAEGYVSSANQMAVDSTYPYYLGSANNFPPYRGWIINHKLAAMHGITIKDMEAMQTDNEDVFAEMARPVLLKLLDQGRLTEAEKKYLDFYIAWNLRDDIGEQGPTIFNAWWDNLKQQTWGDEYAQSRLPLQAPVNSTLLESLLRDGNFVLADNINTKDTVETMKDNVLIAFQKAVKQLAILEKEGKLAWGAYKDTHISHFTKLEVLGRTHLPIGGGTFAINATRSDHGPSWRMIVQLTDTTEAYAVYPGGQSGNPGSKYYDSFVDKWVQGNYYPLLFITKEAALHNSRIKWHLTFTNA
ncbi:acyl-homoserine-lactone acylase [Russula earlei]|uniref:Acyl-homoserine-lactone acylase n=1 Tax=Russula earlei TaxID=71964 RepID=A0ACC0TW30_9AGAM|nr:acyl-homoserine-lactone acylase [Russula earlei]